MIISNEGIISYFKADLLSKHLPKETEEYHRCQDSKQPGRNFEVAASMERFRHTYLLRVLLKGRSSFLCTFCTF
jgi:hypothetical protein